MCRELGISEATYYVWKSKYGGMETSDVQRLQDTEAEHGKLKRMYAELGIGANLLTRWRREADAAGQGAFRGSGMPRDEELTRLKRELARLKKEWNFLREAATFFVRESS